MPFVLIPFGKGTGKIWIITIIVTVILTIFIFKCEDVISGINVGTVTNPLIVFLFVYIIYPIYRGLFWLMGFLSRWGVLTIIAIIFITFIGDMIFNRIKAKRKGKQNE